MFSTGVCLICVFLHLWPSSLTEELRRISVMATGDSEAAAQRTKHHSTRAPRWRSRSVCWLRGWSVFGTNRPLPVITGFTTLMPRCHHPALGPTNLSCAPHKAAAGSGTGHRWTHRPAGPFLLQKDPDVTHPLSTSLPAGPASVNLRVGLAGLWTTTGHRPQPRLCLELARARAGQTDARYLLQKRTLNLKTQTSLVKVAAWVWQHFRNNLKVWSFAFFFGEWEGKMDTEIILASLTNVNGKSRPLHHEKLSMFVEQKRCCRKGSDVSPVFQFKCILIVSYFQSKTQRNKQQQQPKRHSTTQSTECQWKKCATYECMLWNLKLFRRQNDKKHCLASEWMYLCIEKIITFQTGNTLG